MSNPSASESQPKSVPFSAEPGEAVSPMAYRFPSGLALWIFLKFAAVSFWVLGCHSIAVVVYLLPDPWLFWQIVVPAAGGFGPVVSRFRTERREVWLTIDDGPDPITTPRVLDLLDHHGARATFFVVGKSVRQHPNLAREIARRGHQLANHTATHPAHSLWFSGPKRFAQEMDDCATALAEAGISPTPYFRPPVGIKTVFMHRHLARRGVSLVAWSVRGFDSILPETTASQRITKRIAPGAIILAHEGRAELSRVRVLERVLQSLTAAGYATVLPDRDSLIAD